MLKDALGRQQTHQAYELLHIPDVTAVSWLALCKLLARRLVSAWAFRLVFGEAG